MPCIQTWRLGKITFSGIFLSWTTTRSHVKKSRSEVPKGKHIISLKCAQFHSCQLSNVAPIGVALWEGYCSGSLEPEYSCHDRDWIMELPMEADILTFTGILTPEDASVASCCSGSAGASVVAHGVALPLYRDCFLDLRLFNSPDLRRLVLCYCCQAWTLETVLGGNTALPRWWTARSIDADAKR